MDCREHLEIDRIACPWLINRFVDKEAEFLYVPQELVYLLKKLMRLRSYSLWYPQGAEMFPGK